MDTREVVYINIESGCGRFILSDLFKVGSQENYGTPMLQIFKGSSKKEELDLWDNDKYLLKMFVALEKRESTPETIELREFCLEHDFNFHEVGDSLVSLFRQAKKLKLFKNIEE